jgi:long-chain acyl-CoA synthetase
MYTGNWAQLKADTPAVVMAASGEAITYGELERRSNRLAHYLRGQGLGRLDHYSVFMENHPRYVEACAAGERAGLYYTCIISYLQPEEVAYLLQNSRSKVLITSAAKLDIARRALADAPDVERCLVVDGPGDGGRIVGLGEALAGMPDTPITDESLGTAMLYSSGTTGRPKGIIRPLPDVPPSGGLPLFDFLTKLWRYREGMVYLSPAPLYHSAPQAAVNLTIRSRGTAVIMEHFDPEAFLGLIERHRITHTQMVPTMFSRMLKLPDEARLGHDLSSLEIAIHAAAPCPIPVKRQMIEWWGPIIQEYYGATEGLGFTACDSAEWLAHPGTVGQVVLGDPHVLRHAVRVFPRPGEDPRGALGGWDHEHGRRRRLSRR